MASKIFCLVFVVLLAYCECMPQEDKEIDDKTSSEEHGLGGDENEQHMQEKSESGEGTFKDYAEGAKNKFESGAKSFADGIGDRFSKARETIVETGEKMKEAMGNAALNAKDEMEAAASKISKYGQEASEAMKRLFG